MDNKRVLILVESAVVIAMALALSQIRLFRLPQAGSVTLAMVPLVVLAYRRGARAGLMAGIALGLLRLTLDAYVVHWAQFILDYPLAFGLVGLAGFFPNRKFLGVVLVISGVSSVISLPGSCSLQSSRPRELPWLCTLSSTTSRSFYPRLS